MIVSDIGPHDAKILIVGEAPGATEEQQGIPFVGESGKMLKHMLLHVGIDYSSCYITNVSPIRPIGNKFRHYYEDKSRKIPSEELKKMWSVVRRKVEDIKPNIVICLGAEALRAITNKRGIGTWRGCILEYKDIKVIATYHPSAIMRNYGWHPIAEMDLAKALKESTFSQHRIPEVNIITAPTLENVKMWIDECKYYDRIGFDIETVGKHVRCIALSRMAEYTEALVIPFIRFPSSDMALPGNDKIIMLNTMSNSLSSYWSNVDEVEVLRLLASVLESDKLEKVGQNSISFDAPRVLEEFGIETNNHVFDTMHAFHLLYSELPKNLDFLVTILTNYPNYWTDKVTTNDMSEWKYCGMDAICALDISYTLERELKNSEQYELYQHTNELAIALARIQERGVFIDDEARKQLIEEKNKELSSTLDKLRSEAGEDFNPASPKQVSELLYNKLRLPVQKKKGSVTTDETALRKLAVKFPEQKVLRLIINHRKTSKLISTFLDMKLIDGKMITSYNVSGTKGARISSSETLWETGMNLQNIPTGKNKGVTSIRQLFIPSKGKVFIKADLSQAEARIVAELMFKYGNDSTLHDKYKDPNFDLHTWMASKVLNKAESEITYKERWAFGNLPNHSGNYGAGPQVLVTKAAKEEIEGIDYYAADRILKARHKAIPGLKPWWKWVEGQLAEKRMLTTPFGRKRYFFGRLDQTTYRDAYSYVPQSTATGELISRMIVKIEMNSLSKLTVLLQVHDEIDGECYPEDVPAVVKELQEAARVPIYINEEPIYIPIDVEVGTNWRDVVDYKEWLDG